MPSNDRVSIGAWIDPEDLESFDSFMKSRYPGSYSRSQKMVDSMLLYQNIDGILDQANIDFSREMEKRHFVAQAVRHEIQRDEERTG